MNHIEELRKLAEAADLPIQRFAKRRRIAGDDIKLADYFANAHPQTILALLDLVELQHAALESAETAINGEGTIGGLIQCMDGYYAESFTDWLTAYEANTTRAIAAYNKFKEQS